MTTRGSRLLIRIGSLAVAVVGLAHVVCSAHEIGTTRVTISMTMDRYQVEIVTEAQALADKLAAASGQRGGGMLSQPELARRFAGFEEPFLNRATLTFDGARVQPAVGYTISTLSPDAAPSVIIRLTGIVPAGARVLDWTYGWTFASYALTVQPAMDAPAISQWLDGGQTSAAVALTVAAPVLTRSQVAVRYLRLGFTHIVPYGLDHMLFVLGIFLLTRRLRPMLLQVSAFTVAHSITLGLSVFGVVSVTSSIVEPMIALSIAYVAVENLVVRELKPWRIGLVFTFGLLHGLGFAGALRELGLPRPEFVTALVTFNVGVEFGQLAVIGTAFLLVGFSFGDKPWYRRRILVPASALIACVAVFWTLQRLPL